MEAASENGTHVNDVRLLVLKSLIERLTGRKVEVIDPDDLRAPVVNSELQEVAAKTEAPQRAGYGVEYDYYARRVEVEKTSFSADGVIRTADGREIQISIDLSLSRELVQEESVSVRLGDAKLKDPLVINFTGAAAAVTETKFSFDIDICC